MSIRVPPKLKAELEELAAEKEILKMDLFDVAEIPELSTSKNDVWRNDERVLI